MKQKITKQSVYEELANWFLSNRSDVVEKGVIASRLKRLLERNDLPEMRILESHANYAIAKVRTILELKHSVTLYRFAHANLCGYKVASPSEMAEYTAKWVKRTVLYADRTFRLVDAIKAQKCEHLLNHELHRVFDQTSGKIKQVSTTGKRYLKVVATLSKTNNGLLERAQHGKK